MISFHNRSMCHTLTQRGARQSSRTATGKRPAIEDGRPATMIESPRHTRGSATDRMGRVVAALPGSLR